MNVVLVVGTALAVARRRRLAALPVLLVGAALVHLRGYVLPGTPWFAPRLVATLPLPYDPFDHEVPGEKPPRGTLGGPGADAGTKSAEDGAHSSEGGTNSAEGGVAESPGDPRDLGDQGLDDPEREPGGEPDGASRATGEPDALGDAVRPDGKDVLASLVEADIVVDGERVGLDGGFREDWEAEMADLAALDTADLADAVREVAPAAESQVVSDHGGEWVVLDDGSGGFAGRTWLSRPVAVAEAGAVRALEGWGLDRPTRLAAAGAFRTFLETCPDCGAPLEQTTTAACCGGYTNPTEEPADVLFCPDCDVRLFTFED